MIKTRKPGGGAEEGKEGGGGQKIEEVKSNTMLSNAILYVGSVFSWLILSCNSSSSSLLDRLLIDLSIRITEGPSLNNANLASHSFVSFKAKSLSFSFSDDEESLLLYASHAFLFTSSIRPIHCL
jgi:hypothetical protein